MRSANYPTENEIASAVFHSALQLHKTLGPGLLENAYQHCLAHELKKTGLEFREQVAQPLVYETVKLDAGYRLDILVENKVVIEIKSVDALNEVHLAQVITYLKLSGCKLGLLINFNVPKLKDGFKRVVLGLSTSEIGNS